jgi:mannose-6-phosphate isomerase-like protein (cupin superfamily)
MNAPATVLRSIAAVAALSSTLASAPAVAADANADMAMVDPASIKWTDAPPSLPKGAKIAVLHGDPGKAGPFTMRLMMPAGYKVAPHTHSQAESLTVISGTMYFGMGEKAEPSKAHALHAGGFHFVPGKSAHYVFTKVPTVVQGHGEGPFDINYINDADNPEKMAAKAKK